MKSFHDLRNYVTHNRLESAISKIGALQFDDKNRVQEIEEELLKDTLTEFDENNDHLLAELEDTDQSWIKERVLAMVRNLIESLRKK